MRWPKVAAISWKNSSIVPAGKNITNIWPSPSPTRAISAAFRELFWNPSTRAFAEPCSVQGCP
jgi:hypothetical protein